MKKYLLTLILTLAFTAQAQQSLGDALNNKDFRAAAQLAYQGELKKYSVQELNAFQEQVAKDLKEQNIALENEETTAQKVVFNLQAPLAITASLLLTVATSAAGVRAGEMIYEHVKDLQPGGMGKPKVKKHLGKITDNPRALSKGLGGLFGASSGIANSLVLMILSNKLITHRQLIHQARTNIRNLSYLKDMIQRTIFAKESL